MTAIHWFRRDLRLRENPALDAALRAADGRIIPLFILDNTLLTGANAGSARIAFMLDTLRALDAALRERGSRLVLRRGDPLTVLRELAAADVATVTWNRDYTPYARRRDAAAEAMLRGMGIAVHTEPDAAIVEPGAIVSGAGTPYTVFTPFARTWRAYLAANPPDAPAPAPPFAPVPEALAGEPIPTTSALGMIVDQGPLPAGGEAAGYGRLAEFAAPDGPIAAYHTRRDLPAEAGTSHLSAYLRFGCVAPAAALRAAEHAATIPDAAAGAQQWIGELAWRDFYLQIVQHFPHVLRGAFRQQYDAIAWENDELLFAAWCAGRTGYPIVDAAMRQLQREAWMHNRCRMIVASFLTKDLLIDWRWGEQFFMQNLVDGDPAANNGGWQWAAGTGTDAQPYFRIFNPTSQGRKFDPQGAYVRRYVPELRRVPVRYIHEPWKMPATEQQRAQLQIGRDYPAPIVDHAQRRLAALEMYRAVR